jgi:uncharacterized protein YqeY
MSLLDRMYEDMKTAMKAGDKERLGVLRMTIAAIKKEAIDSGATLDDAKETAILQRAVKQRKESADAFAAGGRPELAEKELAEGRILAEYMPRQLADDELDAAVAQAIAETGASSPRDMGKVMGHVLGRHQGLVDGARARAAVQKALGG